jgi:hypothetical protein
MPFAAEFAGVLEHDVALAVVMGKGRKLKTGPLHLLSIVSSFEQPRHKE